jgi:hypothetical protein
LPEASQDEDFRKEEDGMIKKEFKPGDRVAFYSGHERRRGTVGHNLNCSPPQVWVEFDEKVWPRPDGGYISGFAAHTKQLRRLKPRAKLREENAQYEDIQENSKLKAELEVACNALNDVKGYLIGATDRSGVFWREHAEALIDATLERMGRK